MSGYYRPKSKSAKSSGQNGSMLSSSPKNASPINRPLAGKQSGKLMPGCSKPITVPTMRTKASEISRWDNGVDNKQPQFKPQRRGSRDVFGMLGDQIDTFRRMSLSLQGELDLLLDEDPVDNAAGRPRSSSITDYQEVFQQMKLKDPTASMGALHQKTLARLAELNAEREQYEKLLLEDQRQKKQEEWRSRRVSYVDRFVDKITGSGSVGAGSTMSLLDLDVSHKSSHTAPTAPRSDLSVSNHSYDFLMTLTDNVTEEPSRRPSLALGKRDSIFSAAGSRTSMASKASNAIGSVASKYTKRPSMASTFRSSNQSSDAPEYNFALRSSMTEMKKPCSGDNADQLSILSFESSHKPGDFSTCETDGLASLLSEMNNNCDEDSLDVSSKAGTHSSSVVSKGGTRRSRLKKRPTNESEAPVLNQDVAKKSFTRPRKKRVTIEDKPPILNQVVDIPRHRHQYKHSRRSSDASELTVDSAVNLPGSQRRHPRNRRTSNASEISTDSLFSHGSNSLIVGFVDRSERSGDVDPTGSYSRRKMRSPNDSEDGDLIVGFGDRNRRSSTT